MQKKRIVKTPKVYLRDSGVLHYLLNIHAPAVLKVHSVVGHSWEGYCIEQICQLLPHHIQPYYYRTHDGSEMDLVLVKGVKPLACIEIKYSLSPSATRGMNESIRDLKTPKNFILTPGNEMNYPLRKDLRVTDLNTFLLKELPLLIK